jgi:hypothetical protein
LSSDVGTFPNVSRNAIVNVSEIVCYDIVKDLILQHNLLQDSVPCHLTSAVIAGTAAGHCSYVDSEHALKWFNVSFIEHC